MGIGKRRGSATEFPRTLQQRCRETRPLTGGFPEPKGKWAGLQHFRDRGSKVQTNLKFEK